MQEESTVMLFSGYQRITFIAYGASNACLSCLGHNVNDIVLQFRLHITHAVYVYLEKPAEIAELRSITGVCLETQVERLRMHVMKFNYITTAMNSMPIIVSE